MCCADGGNGVDEDDDGAMLEALGDVESSPVICCASGWGILLLGRCGDLKAGERRAGDERETFCGFVVVGSKDLVNGAEVGVALRFVIEGTRFLRTLFGMKSFGSCAGAMSAPSQDRILSMQKL